MVYGNYISNRNVTPQNQPIPGREGEMIKNNAGGYGFKPEDQTLLRRFLLTGTINGSYYQKEFQLVKELFSLLERVKITNPKLLAEEIVYCSEKGVNNHACLLALVYLSMSNEKQLFKDIFRKVVRTGSHFHEWFGYSKAKRGMGRLIKNVSLDWFNQPLKDMAYQVLKYQGRYGFTVRDELRLIKPKVEGERSDLFRWAVGKEPRNGGTWLETINKDGDLKQLWWMEWLKKHPNEGAVAVREGGLTHEMVTGAANMTKEVWQALFEKMPGEATLRNLGSLTEIGILGLNQKDNIEILRERFKNPNILKKLHPVNVLKALKVYQSNGLIGKSKKNWKAVPSIVDILEDTLQNSFDYVETTGKFFFHAIDVSGSMTSKMSEFGASYCEVATAMALATIKAENHYFVGGFNHAFSELNIRKNSSFKEALKETYNRNFGSTDASQAFEYARRHKINVDVFCCWTDSETWSGYKHPTQALREYRNSVNPNAKAVYITLGCTNITLVDPNDKMSYDVAGFDSSVPSIIQSIAKGDL